MNSLSSPHISCHITQLLLAVGSSPSPSPSSALSTGTLQGELGVVLLDAVAPQSLGELKQWPEEETLKYSLERCVVPLPPPYLYPLSPPPPLSPLNRDLAIKHMFDINPVLWECLCLVSSSSSSCASSGLVTCAPIVRSLLTVLTQHWQRCCMDSTAMFPKEVQSSIALVDCMAKVRRSGSSDFVVCLLGWLA